MKIGISVLIQSDFNIWSSGLNQNILFLAQTLLATQLAEEVVLINIADGEFPVSQVDLRLWGLRMVPLSQIGDSLDVIIEMGGALDPIFLDFQRAKGKRVVWCAVGSPFISALAEPFVFDRPGYFPRPNRCDEIWLLPHHMSAAPMLRTLYRCPVWQCPYLWSPHFVQRRAAEIDPQGFHFGFTKPVTAESDFTVLRVAVFEPNISVVKTCIVPMLATDLAYRQAPDQIAHLFVLNSLHLKEHLTMLYLANSMDLVKQHHATFEGRHDIAGFMAEHANAVVAHHWMTSHNNLYLDVLWGDYPLVHNSEWLGDAGYFYPGFDAHQAAEALLRASRDHAKSLPNYRQRSQRLFKEVDPLSRSNRSSYARRLLALTAPAKGSAA